MSRRPSFLPYAAVAIAACSWGTWPLLLRHAESLGAMPAALESAIIMAVMAVLSGVASLRYRLTRRATLRDWAWLGWLGIADAFNVLLFFAAYKLTITVAVLSHYLAPILVAASAPLVLRERLTTRTAVAVAGALMGLALMLARSSAGVGTEGLWLSAALGAGSAFFYASNVIANKFIVDTFSTSEAIFWHCLVAGPLLAAFVPLSAWSTVSPHAVLFLAVASVGPGSIAAMVFLWGLRKMPAAHASTLTLIEPLIAVLLGAAVFGEGIGLRTVLGGAMILGGALLVITQEPPPSADEPLAPAEARGTALTDD